LELVFGKIKTKKGVFTVANGEISNRQNYSNFEPLNQPVLVLNKDKKVIYANSRAKSLFEFSESKLDRQEIAFFEAVELSNAAIVKEMISTGQGNLAGPYVETQFRLSSGRSGIQLMTYQMDQSSTKDDCFWIFYFNGEDSQNSNFTPVSFVDQKTGVASYTKFLMTIEEELRRSIRYQGNLGVIKLNIDQFQHINLAYGHQTGDSVLRKVAQVVKKVMRANDLVARVSGDEFIILAIELSSIDGLDVILNKCLEVVNDIRLGSIEDNQASESVALKASLGGVYLSSKVLPQRFSEAIISELLNQVDENLYQCKSRGGNGQASSLYWRQKL
jgi:diguanylate cyclase (GGDEF)-like protein